MSQSELFESGGAEPETADASFRPLADRMRPMSIDDFAGQDHLLGPAGPLRRLVELGKAHSMVFWGPPGTGKTTLARIIARHCEAQFLTLSAVLAGVKDIRQAIEKAHAHRRRTGGDTILFVDEAHRFNKAQQDAFLPFVESGDVVFIGATTENPSFELNNALLSRARVYVLKSLDEAELHGVIDRAVNDEIQGLGRDGVTVPSAARAMLASAADGDARRALNMLELGAELVRSEGKTELGRAELEAVLAGGGGRRFDKGGDAFYDQISALHKSIRGSSPDATLYWLARMLDGGCDPEYLARRMVRMASEDIGNADPRGLRIALDAWEVQSRLGSSEGELALAQAAVYLACAAKSNAVYAAFSAARGDARELGSLEVPMHLRNAPTRLMGALGHGEAYRYAHDEPDAYAAGEHYFPDAIGERRYYSPPARGLEAKIAEKLATLRALDAQSRGDVPSPHGVAGTEPRPDESANESATDDPADPSE